MKKIFVVVVSIISFFGCKAQQIYDLGTTPSEMSNPISFYVKDINNHHDAIVGVWKWQEGNSYFEITLQEFEHISYPSDSQKFYDQIYGKYKYVEDGNLITETTEITPMPIFNIALNFETPTKYFIGIKDFVSDTGKVGYFTLTSPNTATFKVWNSEGVKLFYGNGLPYSMPTDLILTKQ